MLNLLKLKNFLLFILVIVRYKSSESSSITGAFERIPTTINQIATA